MQVPQTATADQQQTDHEAHRPEVGSREAVAEGLCESSGQVQAAEMLAQKFESSIGGQLPQAEPEVEQTVDTTG